MILRRKRRLVSSQWHSPWIQRKRLVIQCFSWKIISEIYLRYVLRSLEEVIIISPTTSSVKKLYKMTCSKTSSSLVLFNHHALILKWTIWTTLSSLKMMGVQMASFLEVPIRATPQTVWIPHKMPALLQKKTIKLWSWRAISKTLIKTSSV